MGVRLVGSEMCIRDSCISRLMSVSAQHAHYRYYSSAEPPYKSYHNHTSERRKALKSRQRANLIDSDHQTVQKHQFLVKILNFKIFEFHDPSRGSESAPSFQIRFAIWHHGSKGKGEKTCRKIRLGQTNSQISRNPAVNTRRAAYRLSLIHI